MDMQKAGPVFPQTFSRVVFRINGENQSRVFDPRSMDSSCKPLEAMQELCQIFVDLRCRPLMISPDCGKTWNVVGKLEVDMFFCDHPEVK